MSPTTMSNEETGIFKKGLKRRPSDEEPIRLFIGTSEHEEPTIEAIYLYSIFKNTDHPVEVTFLRPSMFPDWKRKGWGTPFTCFRYAIPELCGFKGRAIYTDVDMINFRDIYHLWRTNLKGKPFGMVWDSLQMNDKKWQDTEHARGWWCDSVMLIDCEKAKDWIDPISVQGQWNGTYKWYFMEKIGSPHRKESSKIVQELDCRWNSFDGSDTSAFYEPEVKGHRMRKTGFKKVQLPLEEIWQVHLTALSYQPWHPKYNPHAKASHNRQDIMEVYWRYNKIVKMIGGIK